jgi:hypothetical protein
MNVKSKAKKRRRRRRRREGYKFEEAGDINQAIQVITNPTVVSLL